MVYGKLPIVLLSTLAAEKNGSTNASIAACILSHLEDVRTMGIREMAALCHVGTASISRFCKEIGLDGFPELRQLLTESLSASKISEGQYAHKIIDALEKSRASLQNDVIDELCRDMMRYDKISAFGLLKAEAAAICLQTDLLELGKKVYTNMHVSEQIAKIESAGAEELILLFSYTGTYFDACHSRLRWNRHCHPRIWMICGEGCEKPPYVNRVLHFASDGTLEGHPYQLLYAEGRIYRRLRKMFSENGKSIEI